MVQSNTMNGLRSLEQLDWSSLSAVADATKRVMSQLAADPKTLTGLLKNIANSPQLLDMCEHYDILDKLVLFKGVQQDYRLRLHVFLPGYFDRPHNHRWTYSSLILRGSYRHVIYSSNENINTEGAMEKISPIMEREEKLGSFYTLNHTAIHAATAEPYTTSLIIRGPSVKDRFRIVDKVSGESWWQYGAAKETEELRLSKKMSNERLLETLELLEQFGLMGKD